MSKTMVIFLLQIEVNSSNAGDGIVRLLGANTMPADALAPKVARASAGIVLVV